MPAVMDLKPFATAAAVCSLAFASACDKAADAQAKANVAQAKANDEIAVVARDANQKIALAQAEADKKFAEANAAFAQLREDYRHSTTTAMVALDKQLAAADEKVVKAKSKAKAELAAKVQQARADREAFVAEYKSLETASALTWDATKARLDKQWAALSASVDAL